MNYLTSSLLLFLAAAFTKAHWTYLAIGLVAFIIVDAFLIRWAIKQMRVEPDTETDDLVNASAANTASDAVAARSSVGVPRNRSLRPRDPQAEAAAAAGTGSGMPELASAAPAAASLGDLRPGDEISSSPGKLASYEPLIPFSPGAAADNPLPSPSKSITPEPVGSLMELVPAAPVAPVVPVPAESISIPLFTGKSPVENPSEFVKPAEPVAAGETIAKVAPPETPPADKTLVPTAGLVEIPSVPTNPQPVAESKPVEMPPSPEPTLKADPDDVKKTKTPKSSAQTSPAVAESIAPLEALPVEKAAVSLPGLVLPTLIPVQGAAKEIKLSTPAPVEKAAAIPVPVAALPEGSVFAPPVPDAPVSSTALTELPALTPATPVVPEVPAAALVPESPAPVPDDAPVASEKPESAPEKPAKAAGKPSGRGRVFLPSIFGKSADKAPAPVEPATPEPAVPAPAGPLAAVSTPPAAEITGEKEAVKESAPTADITKPVVHPEDARLETLQSIAREPDPEAPTPEPIQGKIETPVAPSVEEDISHLTAKDADKEKTPASEPPPVVEAPITPAISVPSDEAAETPNPNPGLSPVDAGHIHGAAVEPAKEAQPEPVAVVSPEPEAAKVPAPEPVELHDIPLLATEPPVFSSQEPAPSAPIAEVPAERVDKAPVLPQSFDPSAEALVEMPLAPTTPAPPRKPDSEPSPTESQTAAAPAEVASTTTPRSTMPTTDTTSSQAPGARASAQLTLGFEVTSLQLTPFFKLGAVQLRPLSNVVSLHLITTDQAENPLAAGISFQIDTVDLDENSHVKSILLKPLGQAQAATVPQPKLQVDNVQVGQGVEGPIQVTSSQGTSTAVQLLATCTIAAMDFTPSFEIGSLRLEPTSNTVLLRSAPSQRPAALDLPPSFEVANVLLEGAAQIASVRLTPSGTK